MEASPPRRKVFALKVALAQYPVGFLSSWQEYTEKISHWVDEASTAGADLLVFPEYSSMELASLFTDDIREDVTKQIVEMQSLLPQVQELHRTLAQEHGVYILAGSFPVDTGEGMVNRAYFFNPQGQMDFQDKCIMTRFENEQWGIQGGDHLKIFETRHGKVGVLICYDSEFPLLARQLTDAGADVLLVPSCTDTMNGFYRVRVGSQARALENQCFVLQAPLVGGAPWSEAIDINLGQAAVYTPPDYGFPPNGILTEGELNAPQWLYANLDLSALREVRRNGQVFNTRDWPHQLPERTLKVVDFA